MQRLRLAAPADEPAMRDIMDRAIAELVKPYLPPDAVAASFEIMGLDSELIADGTYFAVIDNDQIVGCGGWSRRATLFGGDHTAGRNAALLDPSREPAGVRAMYTDPAHVRRGVGRTVLSACEAAARAEGFRRTRRHTRRRAALPRLRPPAHRVVHIAYQAPASRSRSFG